MSIISAAHSAPGADLLYKSCLDDGIAVGLYGYGIVHELAVEWLQVLETGQYSAHIAQLYRVAAPVDEDYIVQLLSLTGKADEAAVVDLLLVDDEVYPSVLHVGYGLSYAAELRNIGDELLILMSPWVAAAVEGVLVAL